MIMIQNTITITVVRLLLLEHLRLHFLKHLEENVGLTLSVWVNSWVWPFQIRIIASLAGQQAYLGEFGKNFDARGKVKSHFSSHHSSRPPALPTRAVKFSHELTQVSLLIITSLKQSSKKAGCLKRTRTRVLLASPSPIKSLKSSVSCTEFSTITVTQIRFIEGVCCRYCAVCSLQMIKTQLQKKNRWKKNSPRLLFLQNSSVTSGPNCTPTPRLLGERPGYKKNR